MVIIQEIALLLRLIAVTLMMKKWHLMMIQFQMISKGHLEMFQMLLVKQQLQVAA